MRLLSHSLTRNGARPMPGQMRKKPNAARIVIHPTIITQTQVSAEGWCWFTIQRAAVPRELAAIMTLRRKRKSPVPQFSPSVANDTALSGCENEATIQAGKKSEKALLGTKM
jgi:hypothetical protein